jgi:hypothetical protein
MRHHIYVILSVVFWIAQSWSVYLAKYGKPETALEILLNVPSIAHILLMLGFNIIAAFALFEWFFFLRRGENE